MTKRPEPSFHLPGLLTEQQPSLHRASRGHKQAVGARKATSPEHLTTDVPSALLSCQDTRRKASAHPSNNWKQLQKILHSKALPAEVQRSPPKGTRAHAVAFGETRCLCAPGSPGLFFITFWAQHNSFSCTNLGPTYLPPPQNKVRHRAAAQRLDADKSTRRAEQGNSTYRQGRNKEEQQRRKRRKDAGKKEVQKMKSAREKTVGSRQDSRAMRR